jgi:outer membrane protein TolC
MKRTFIGWTACLFALTTYSQSIDYNKIILPEKAANIEFEEKLVQLAWKNHPLNLNVYNNLSVAKHETKIESAEWLNTIRISGNLNEFNINSSGNLDNQSQFYPRYNFGIILPLGIFTSTSNSVKRGKQLEQVAQNNINAQKLAIRSQVLKLYNEFLMFKEIFSLRSQELEEATANFVLLEQRFKSGEEKYENYTQGLSLLNNVKIDRVQAQTNYLNAKLNIEELIGIKLEDVK